jgi:Lon-like protease
MTTPPDTLPPPPVAPKRRRLLTALLSVLTVLIAFVIVASFINEPYYALVPGQAMNVAQLLTVPKGEGHSLHGRVLLTDVGVDNLKLISLIGVWFNEKLFGDDVLVPIGSLTGNLPVSEFNAEGTVDMAESQLTANSVALRQLGYQVPETNAGVTVYVIDPGSPAWNILHVGDVITSVDGVPTPNPNALVAAIRTHSPGEQVTLRVGSIDHPFPGHNVTLRLGSEKQKGAPPIPIVGIGDPAAPVDSMGTQPSYKLPFTVKINADNIGGPSAGLAFTLAILDSLSGGQLTGGRVVAATGTIDPDGSVGDVGGVAQKTVAVERAGATLFLVPEQELAVARSKATSTLTVLGVSSLQQALDDLARHGGKLGAAASGPPAGVGGHSVPTDWQDSPWS